MVTIKPIRNDDDLDNALARIDEIFEAVEGTPESDELDILADLVELYESRTVEMGYPTPVAAIEFRMEQADLKPRDLIPFIGSRSKVSEILSGKRAITMSMARALHAHLGIPADVLLQEPGATIDEIEASRFPLKQMAKAGWIPDVPDLLDHAEELITDLIRRAGGPKTAVADLFRKNNDRRINAKTDEYALRAWCWQVMALVMQHPPVVGYEQGTVTQGFLRELAQLSTSDDGPRRAQDFLQRHGIGFVTLRHLRNTHLDGAAIRLANGRPVIGLTLRYDRIDNFWFTLLHELAHIGLHLDSNEEDVAFVDDHSLRGIEATGGESKEERADQWAEDALIPLAIWEDSEVRDHPTAMSVIDLAWEAKVHPAIVAGRVRHEEGNYRLLSQFVGTGEVRKHFE